MDSKALYNLSYGVFVLGSVVVGRIYTYERTGDNLVDYAAHLYSDHCERKPLAEDYREEKEGGQQAYYLHMVLPLL